MKQAHAPNKVMLTVLRRDQEHGRGRAQVKVKWDPMCTMGISKLVEIC